MPILNKRLIVAANMLRQEESVADIGTDHAFLPIYLIKNGIAKKVIASDIAKGPLSVARDNINKYQMSDKIELRLANGLEGIKPMECNQITILGMGGETIADIMKAAPWIKNKEVTLILQPMSHDDRLREYLINNMFSIIEEKAVESQKRLYTVMKVGYSGEKIKVGAEYKYVGELLNNTEKDSQNFIKRRLNNMKNCREEIKNIERKKELYLELDSAIEKIEKALSK